MKSFSQLSFDFFAPLLQYYKLLIIFSSFNTITFCHHIIAYYRFLTPRNSCTYYHCYSQVAAIDIASFTLLHMASSYVNMHTALSLPLLNAESTYMAGIVANLFSTADDNYF